MSCFLWVVQKIAFLSWYMLKNLWFECLSLKYILLSWRGIILAEIQKLQIFLINYPHLKHNNVTNIMKLLSPIAARLSDIWISLSKFWTMKAKNDVQNFHALLTDIHGQMVKASDWELNVCGFKPHTWSGTLMSRRSCC